MKTVKISVLLCAALISMQTTALFAQSFSVLHAFSANKDGQLPSGGVTTYGNTLYGVTFQGDNGSGYDSGTIYSISTNGSAYSILYSFSGSDGANPESVPVVSSGFIYGTTTQGGSNFDGVIYSLGLTGSNNFHVLHAFDDGLGGRYALGDLLLAGGTLYGTTSYGGTNNAGAIYSISSIGSGFTILHNFTGLPDGDQPCAGQLVLSSNTLYGMTTGGGAENYGMIYSINTNGSNYTVLYSFGQPGGITPMGNLVLSGNTLYGTVQLGGSNDVGAVFAIGTDGSNYHQLHAFGPLPDGEQPKCTLTLSSNTLYGTANLGGNGNGAVFSINTDGTGYQSLYSFSAGSPTNNADGVNPQGTLLLLGTNLYGVAPQGGSNGKGTLFELGVTTSADTAPVITVQPLNVAVIIGSNATLTVTATGLPAPTYQWQFNGTNIALATDSSYTVTNAQLTCAGNYSVIVSNSVSAVASSDGYLAVAAAPFFYGEASLGGEWCWLQDSNSIFGFYKSPPELFPFIYHLDLGWEFFFDADNANRGGYFYDFTDGVFFYTEPGLFPFLFDFKANAWMWYYPDPSLGVGRYTSKPRVFYNYTTKNQVNHL